MDSAQLVSCSEKNYFFLLILTDLILIWFEKSNIEGKTSFASDLWGRMKEKLPLQQWKMKKKEENSAFRSAGDWDDLMRVL